MIREAKAGKLKAAQIGGRGEFIIRMFPLGNNYRPPVHHPGIAPHGDYVEQVLITAHVMPSPFCIRKSPLGL